MSCGTGGKKKFTYTGNEVGWFNFVGLFNFVAGGPPGSGLSAGAVVQQFIPDPSNPRPWLRQDAVMGDALLDAAYPTMELNWIADIQIDPEIVFRISDKSFYVQDSDGIPRYYDARAESAPSVTVTLGEWLNANYEVGNTQITLNNRDGFYNDYLPQGKNYRQWTGGKMTIKIGFGEKYSNYFTIFEGTISVQEGLTTTRDSVNVQAYDKLNQDEQPIPVRVFDSQTYPNISSDFSGKPIPLIYGDWTENVDTWGNIPATCTNALDGTTEIFNFKISDQPVQSITSIWLHRGNRKAGESLGPIQLDPSQIIFALDNGEFNVLKGTPVLTSLYPILDNATAGPGTAGVILTAKDATVDFEAIGVQVNDQVLQVSTGEFALVTAVSVAQLQVSGVTFAPDDSIVIYTNQYTYLDGDKVSVTCTGKNLNLINTYRLGNYNDSVIADIGGVNGILIPYGIAVGPDDTVWIADNQSQNIFNLDFTGNVLESIAYSLIDSGLTNVDSLSFASDNKLWVIDHTTSTIYRIDHVTKSLSLSFTTGSVTGIGTDLANISGIAVQPDNKIWIFDKATGNFYLIDPFSSVNPFVVRTFNITAFDSTATDINGISYDSSADELVVVDRHNLKGYRINETTGALISFFLLSALASNITFPTGIWAAQDGSLFVLDRQVLTFYNYAEDQSANDNAGFIARDILKSVGNHTYADYDLSWNFTCEQLSALKCRVALDTATKAVTYVINLLTQFNVSFFTRFQKFSLFWINFENFVTNGKIYKEKDLKIGTWAPGKEINQYFNSCTADYGYNAFTGNNLTSDTYVSSAGISFAGGIETNKKIDAPNLYRRQDLDIIIPLLVRLAVPEPEFVEMELGFRVIRSQLNDFVSLNFDDSTQPLPLGQRSGRRFTNVPGMVRQLDFNLEEMSVKAKVWSLGNTPFGDYLPVGPTVGGENDAIVLSNLGRLGRISPTGTITGAPAANQIQLADQDSQDAEHRSSMAAGLAWAPGYKVSIVDGATKVVIQDLTIVSVSGQVITFLEDVLTTPTNTVKNAAGFITGGNFIQYSQYRISSSAQRAKFASFTRPDNNYPTTRAQEINDQRSGVHSFDDGGIPFILYPINFVGGL